MEKTKIYSPTIQLPENFHVHEFAKLAKSERDPRKVIRLTGLSLLQQKKSLNETVRLLKATKKTVRGWLKNFIKYGLDGLSDKHRSGRPPRLKKDKEADFVSAVIQLQKDRKGGRATGHDIQKLAEEKFNAKYSLDRIYTLLAQLKVVWITGRSQHPKANEAAQEAFKKDFEDEVRKVLPKDVSLDQVEIYFEDEARVGQQGTLTRVWAKKGTRPRLTKQGQFLNAYIWGIVCPARDLGLAYIWQSVDTDIMNTLLEELSKIVSPGKHAVLVLDNAAFHKSKGVKIPKNISLLPLPPYSPELNPMEQVWEQLRQKSLANRAYSNYSDIETACMDAWNKFAETVGAIKNLCSRTWANVATP